MGKKPVQHLIIILLALVLICSQVSAHSPSNMNITCKPDSDSILVAITHQVDDPSTHYVNEIILKKNGKTINTSTYGSQPSADIFSYRYLLPLQGGDTVSVTARCNIGGSITREYTNPGPAVSATAITASPSLWSYSSFWPVHAVFMAVGFLCFLASALIPLYGKHLKGWYPLHVRVSCAGAILTIIGLGVAFAMVSLSGGPNFRVPHAYLGLLVLVVLSLVLGLALLRSFASANRKATVRNVHLWLGRLLVILMAANIAMGLNTVGLI